MFLTTPHLTSVLQQEILQAPTRSTLRKQAEAGSLSNGDSALILTYVFLSIPPSGRRHSFLQFPRQFAHVHCHTLLQSKGHCDTVALPAQAFPVSIQDLINQAGGEPPNPRPLGHGYPGSFKQLFCPICIKQFLIHGILTSKCMFYHSITYCK